MRPLIQLLPSAQQVDKGFLWVHCQYVLHANILRSFPKALSWLNEILHSYAMRRLICEQMGKPLKPNHAHDKEIRPSTSPTPRLRNTIGDVKIHVDHYASRSAVSPALQNLLSFDCGKQRPCKITKRQRAVEELARFWSKLLEAALDDIGPAS